MKESVLVVEDEKAWSDLTCEILKKSGYQVRVADNADLALQELRPAPPDLMILDVNLKGISGLDLCALVRKEPETARLPILMLTGMKSERDKVKGLETGADDYLAKPFGREELVARVKALLRRAKGGPTSGPLRFKDLSLDPERHEVLIKNKPIELRPKEFELLKLLMSRSGRVLPKQFLAEAVWGKDLIVTSQTLSQHVKNLRSKLGACADYIETIETVGYKFRER